MRFSELLLEGLELRGDVAQPCRRGLFEEGNGFSKGSEKLKDPGRQTLRIPEITTDGIEAAADASYVTEGFAEAGNKADYSAAFWLGAACAL